MPPRRPSMTGKVSGSVPMFPWVPWTKRLFITSWYDFGSLVSRRQPPNSSVGDSLMKDLVQNHEMFVIAVDERKHIGGSTVNDWMKANWSKSKKLLDRKLHTNWNLIWLWYGQAICEYVKKSRLLKDVLSRTMVSRLRTHIDCVENCIETVLAEHFK